jgi:putative spermidine/putrescine transport system permease protein
LVSAAAMAMNTYATPVLLGGPRFQMTAPVVANEVLNQSNWPFGAALAFMLMLVTLAVANVVVFRRYS